MRIRSEELQVGDTIEVWWKPGQDTVLKIEPYEGKNLAHLMHGVARFAVNTLGMSLREGATLHTGV